MRLVVETVGEVEAIRRSVLKASRLEVSSSLRQWRPVTSKASAPASKLSSVVVVDPVVGSSASTKATMASVRRLALASPACRVPEWRLCDLASALFELHVDLWLASGHGGRHVLVHEHRRQQALLQESLGCGLLGGEQRAIHGLLVTLEDLSAAPNQVLQDVGGRWRSHNRGRGGTWRGSQEARRRI